MLSYTFLLISVTVPAVWANLEVCVCCGFQTGQPVTEECDIPAKSFTDNELASLEQLCYNLQLNDNNYYSDSRYETYRSLKYIVLNGSRVDYNEFSKDDCSRITREWKGRMFWIPEESSWTLTDSGDLLSRKVVNISDSNDKSWFQWLTSQSPNLTPFNRTNEFVLRIIPSSNVIHDIEYLTETETFIDDPFLMSRIDLKTSEFYSNVTVEWAIPEASFFQLNSDYSHFEVMEHNRSKKIIRNWMLDANVRTVRFNLDIEAGSLIGSRGNDVRYNLFGQKVNIERSFTAKMSTALMESSPVNEALTTEQEITGKRIDLTAVFSGWERTTPSDPKLFYITYRRIGNYLFILAGCLTLAGLIYYLWRRDVKAIQSYREFTERYMAERRAVWDQADRERLHST
ncbi:hypothetical protein DMENIID0001_167850 [Sergentomyia squamirostris]